MPFFPELNTYLHQSSLLLQAYPNTARITTKYSLPRREATLDPSDPSKISKRAAARIKQAPQQSSAATIDATTTPTPAQHQREKREPTATLTLKTYDPTTGICLKYKTDKAAEVGRLMAGLGRLARGEVLEAPSIIATKAVQEGEGDKMDVDEVVDAKTGGVEGGKKQQMAQTQAQQTQQTTGKAVGSAGGTTGGNTGGSGGGKGKKKKGKK